MPKTNNSNLLAAIDLGSNSFHLIIARDVNGQLVVIDKIKEMVRLASGIDKNGNLNEEKMQVALECLSRFGQRLREISSNNVRIVGTNTLRKAKNSADFIAQAEKALNHQIEVIAGREEARLIYLGVAHSQSDNSKKRLVMDIGGGSTEYIIGQAFEPTMTESLCMGCVSMTLKEFSNGKLSEKNFSKAILAAELELRSIKNQYLMHGWQESTGASGTIRTVEQVLLAQFEQTYKGITPEGLMWLKQEMIAQKKIEKLSLPGLSPDRNAIFVGGVAIMIATFKVLQISLMTVSDSALREGLIYDMLGRRAHEDVRARTIDHFTQQYHISTLQADRVAHTTMYLYKLFKNHWPINNEESENDLLWAAKLHEIGFAIARNQYYKHGSYIVSHADMPGFSKADQKRLAMLIRAQSGKLPLDELLEFSAHFYNNLVFQIIILRLAVLFNRGRSDKTFPKVQIEASESSLTIVFPKNYFIEKPLTYADLLKETKRLKKINFELVLLTESQKLNKLEDIDVQNI